MTAQKLLELLAYYKPCEQLGLLFCRPEAVSARHVSSCRREWVRDHPRSCLERLDSWGKSSAETVISCRRNRDSKPTTVAYAACKRKQSAFARRNLNGDSSLTHRSRWPSEGKSAFQHGSVHARLVKGYRRRKTDARVAHAELVLLDRVVHQPAQFPRVHNLARCMAGQPRVHFKNKSATKDGTVCLPRTTLSSGPSKNSIASSPPRVPAAPGGRPRAMTRDCLRYSLTLHGCTCSQYSAVRLSRARARTASSIPWDHTSILIRRYVILRTWSMSRGRPATVPPVNVVRL